MKLSPKVREIIYDYMEFHYLTHFDRGYGIAGKRRDEMCRLIEEQMDRDGCECPDLALAVSKVYAG